MYKISLPNTTKPCVWITSIVTHSGLISNTKTLSSVKASSVTVMFPVGKLSGLNNLNESNMELIHC